MTDEERLISRREQITGHTTREDNVRRALAHDVVRDRDIAATGIAHLRRLHGPSILEQRPTRVEASSQRLAFQGTFANAGASEDRPLDSPNDRDIIFDLSYQRGGSQCMHA